MSKLLIDDKPVMVLPKLAQAIGLNEAVVLQQIHYWLKTYQEANKAGHLQDGRWWVYNTKKEWQENFPWWSENTVWRALTALREREIVLATSEYNKKGYDKTLWYTIDYDKLNELENDLIPKTVKPCTQNGKMEVPKMVTPIPETNTETNTDIKRLPPDGDPEYVDAGDEFEEKAKGVRPDKRQAHNEMVQALMDATELDMKIKSNAGRIYKASKELREAGYTPEDVIAFKENWKQDWRYRKDGQPPSIAVVHSEIKKAERKIPFEELQEQRVREIREELESQGIDINDYDYLRKD